VPDQDARSEYQRLRAAHVNAVRASLEDHVARLDWPRERIERYRTARLRSLLALARERSPFHAARMGDVDPATATPDDLARLPAMVKSEVQESWDAIVTTRDIDRAGAERVLAEQPWFSYTAGGLQVFSSGGSSGVRGVYVWDWDLFVTLACLGWRWQVRAERSAGQPLRPARLAVLSAGEQPHASTPLFDIATGPAMETVVIPAASPFEDVRRAVAGAQPTHLVGHASVIGRLARSTIAGDLDLHPVRVSTNSEPLTDEDREAITTAWGAPVHNLWGSTEIGVQAVGCGVGEGLHICEDEVVPERVDADGRAVGADEPASRTLATGSRAAPSPSSATTSATRSPCSPADASAAARCCASPTSRDAATTTSDTASRWCPPARSATSSAPTRGSPSTRCTRPWTARRCWSSAHRSCRR
jgi:phenylacetate-coenzyme A ligase PaaK-like adenylate-forming protein